MTISVTIPSTLEQKVLAAAEARHLTVDAYFLSLAEADLPHTEPPPLAAESESDFMAAMRSLSKTSKPVRLPYQTWPREAIYRDHD